MKTYVASNIPEGSSDKIESTNGQSVMQVFNSGFNYTLDGTLMSAVTTIGGQKLLQHKVGLILDNDPYGAGASQHAVRKSYCDANVTTQGDTRYYRNNVTLNNIVQASGPVNMNAQTINNGFTDPNSGVNT